MLPRPKLTALNLADLDRQEELTLVRGVTPDGLLAFGNFYSYLDPRPEHIPGEDDLDGWDAWVYIFGAATSGRVIVRARFDPEEQTAPPLGGQHRGVWGHRLTPTPIQLVEGRFIEHGDRLRLGTGGTPLEMAQPLAVVSIYATGRQFTVDCVHSSLGYALRVYRGKWSAETAVAASRPPVETFKERWDGLRDDLEGIVIELLAGPQAG